MFLLLLELLKDYAKILTKMCSVNISKQVGLSRATLDSQVKVFQFNLTGLPKKGSMGQEVIFKLCQKPNSISTAVGIVTKMTL